MPFTRSLVLLSAALPDAAARLVLLFWHRRLLREVTPAETSRFRNHAELLLSYPLKTLNLAIPLLLPSKPGSPGAAKITQRTAPTRKRSRPTFSPYPSRPPGTVPSCPSDVTA